MKRKGSIFALTLLLLCMLPMALNIQLVKADRQGVGKFLTIEIVGEGYVTATKVESGETWDFVWADPPMTEKVGAGTVELEAFASNGWEFSCWGGDLTGSESPTDYKTRKYGYVVAVFEELTHTITASADPEGFINPAGAVIVTHGDDQTFTFGPTDPDYHISAIVVDGGPPLSGFLETYTFENVTADHTIHVSLDLIGTVSVPAGPGGSFNVDQFASLTIGPVITGGVILGSSVIDLVPPGTSIRLYVIEWGALTIEGGVVLAFLVPEEIDPYELTIVHGDSWQAIYSDVNKDLVVDCADVWIVAKHIFMHCYDPVLDINNDGAVDCADLAIVRENIGAILEDVTDSVVGEPPGPYFVTTIPIDDNPCFRVH